MKIDEIIKQIDEKEKNNKDKEVFSLLSKTEAATLRFMDMVWQVNNGGFLQWFDNGYMKRDIRNLIPLCRRGIAQEIPGFDTVLLILYELKNMALDDKETDIEDLYDELDKLDTNFYNLKGFEDSIQSFIDRMDEQVDISKVKTPHFKPKCKLVGRNGNIFNLYAIVDRCLKSNDLIDERNELEEKFRELGKSEDSNYDKALCLLMDYVDVY